MDNEYTEVTKDIFYAKIGPLNVNSVIINDKWPYSSDFILASNREVVGKTVDRYTDGVEHQYPIVKKYYLLKALLWKA
jgi:hypothetical protein